MSLIPSLALPEKFKPRFCQNKKGLGSRAKCYILSDKTTSPLQQSSKTIKPRRVDEADFQALVLFLAPITKALTRWSGIESSLVIKQCCAEVLRRECSGGGAKIELIRAELTT